MNCITGLIKGLPCALLLSALPGLNARPSIQSLFQTEQAYCDRAAEVGMIQASLEFAAPQAQYLGVAAQQHLRGEAAVRLEWGESAGTVVTWDPESAEISASRDLGFTVGSFTSTSPARDGKVHIAHGHYCTIWKLQPDGRWKFLLDTGSVDSQEERDAEKQGPLPQGRQ